jgi:uncharacterized protein
MLLAMKLVLIFFVVIYLLVALGLYSFQESLIFHGEKLPEDYVYRFDMEFEEVFVNTSDGARLNALHFKAEKPKGIILYFHGNAGSLARWGEVVEPFVAMGYDVLIPDYRGYGKSTGKRSKKVLLADAEQWYAYVQQYFEEKDVLVYGRSLGSSFASHLGGKFKPGKIFLETPFYSLADVVRKTLPMYPLHWLIRYDFENGKALKDASSPVVIFHGTDDAVVPYESGQKLYGSLKGKDIKFYTIQGGGHNDLAGFDVYWDSVAKELE